MGYVEMLCQLCGVSLAIARYRRADEPESAAWDYTRRDFLEVDDHSSIEEECGPDSGCTGLLRMREIPQGEEAEEHLAGPGCVATGGYSGYRISLAEMKDCNKVQCLVPKNRVEGWTPSEDDQDFEREGKVFLSGYGNGSPGEHEELEIVENVRHGMNLVWIYNITELNEEHEFFGLPFHPNCFKIFTHASKLRFGRVDADGLMDWRNATATLEYVHEKFPRIPAVLRASEQWWTHEPGSEWLAANPVDVPGLQQLLKRSDVAEAPRRSCCSTGPDPPSTSKKEDEPRRRYTDCCFGRSPMYQKSRGRSAASSKHDPFADLPRELLDSILDYLPSKSLANLRLATRTTADVPIVLFRRFIREDMPWFWEVDDMDPGANWPQLYFNLKFLWAELKGLRNRKRIWKDVNHILDSIEELRAKGTIPG